MDEQASSEMVGDVKGEERRDRNTQIDRVSQNKCNP